MNTRAFLEALPLPVRRAWVVADDEIASTAPPGLLMNMARDFGSAWEAQVLLRFAEIARQKNRLDLIDAAALRGLALLATSPEGGAYLEPLVRLVDSFNDEALQALAAPGPDDLLQIRLALGDYDGLAKAMLKQSALLYRGEKQVEYLRVVERIFSETPLNEAVVGAALDGISRGGIKSVPYIVASIGLLKGQTPSSELDHVAEATVQLLMQDRLLLESVPPANVLAVLNYFIQRKDVVGAIRAAALIPLSAAYQGSNGIRIMSQMYKLMGSDDKTRTAGLYMLRAFVREASDEEAQRAVVYFGRELGESVARALETTYAFRSLMGGLDLLAYAERVHLAAEFLQATASAYMDARNTPTTGAITNVLDDLISTIAVGERRLLSKTMVTLLKAVVLLGKQYRTNRPRDENRFVNRLLTGEADPRSALDVFKAMGGYFARGRRFDVTLGNGSLRIFNERTGDDLRDSLTATAALLEDLIRTLPLAKPPTLQTTEIRAEVESQWSQVEVEQQRAVVRDLANDLQRIVDIIVFLEANGDANVAEDTSAASKRLNSGRQRPKSTLELYRFMAAYFRARG
jgi:hypothetical protein